MSFMTDFEEDTANFLQQLSDALCRGVLAVGDILKIVAAEPHPHDIHLLFRDAFCKVMQKKGEFKLLQIIV